MEPSKAVERLMMHTPKGLEQLLLRQWCPWGCFSKLLRLTAALVTIVYNSLIFHIRSMSSMFWSAAFCIISANREAFNTDAVLRSSGSELPLTSLRKDSR